MSALAFPPAPSLPRHPFPARTHPTGDPQQRRRHLQLVPDIDRHEGARGATEAEERPASQGQVRMRLTTRGRRVLVVAAFAAAIAVGSGLGALFPSEPAAPEGVQEVVVAQGESLWAIATSVAGPGQDVREVIEQIRVLNDLDGSVVVAGQMLSVPQG